MNCVRRGSWLNGTRVSLFITNITVGEYVADPVVEDPVVVEPKASKAVDPAHSAQCINYLKATGPHLRLLLNFARPRLEIHRVAHEL
jgi:GxxExxY protein